MGRVRQAGLAVLIGVAAASGVVAADVPKPADWPMFGQNAANTATNVTEVAISPKTVSTLKTKWVFTTGGDVSARAAVVNHVAYFPDWGGNLWAVNANNGQLVWGHQLSDYISGPGTIHSRTSPAVANGIVYVGTQEGATLLAINAASGSLLWKTQLETLDPYAIVTCSPVVVGGVVYAGVASVADAGAEKPC